MFNKDKSVRDAYTFSLGGMRTITSFTTAPAVADDRFRQIRESQSSDIQEDQPLPPTIQPGLKGRFWLSSRRRAA
jgi:hypothetical protein